MLGPMLVSMHNLTYYQKVVAEARRAIAEDRLASLIEQRRRSWERMVE
jgi:queuine tRNA-ribosyltransferase